MTSAKDRSIIELANEVIRASHDRRQHKGSTASGAKGYRWLCNQCFTFATGDLTTTIPHTRGCIVLTARKYATVEDHGQHTLVGK